ncbi:MAG: hypothetical protein JXA23_10180 [Bacteroidales bacterium]|nr:hypothetical protein [Bacteroidales bacterium]
MNKKSIVCFVVLYLLIVFQANSQVFGNDPEIQIDQLLPENVWQIAEMALTEKGFGTGKFDPSTGSLYSDWIDWTAVTVSNRARLFFTYDGSTLVLRIVDRQYKSNEGWSEAIGNLSKKKYIEYVQSVADRINLIKNDPQEIRQAIKSSKLLPAFIAVNMMDNTKWKLLEVIPGEQDRPTLYFEVTNTGSTEVTLAFMGGEFEKIGATGTARIHAFWEPNTGEATTRPSLKPGETIRIKLVVGQGYKLKTGIGYVMQCRFEYVEGQSKRETLKIYNIPVPYTYQEGD